MDDSGFYISLMCFNILTSGRKETFDPWGFYVSLCFCTLEFAEAGNST